MSIALKPMTNGDVLRFVWQQAGGWSGFWSSHSVHFAVLVTAVCFSSWTTKEWCATVISVVPSLLGFTLSGFAIFLGFGSDDFKQVISHHDETKSTYLSTSSAFLFFVVVQLASLIYALAAQSLYVPPPKFMHPFVVYIEWASYAGGAVGYFMFVWGLLLSLRAAMRIFRLSRWLHVHLVISTLKKVEKEGVRPEHFDPRGL